ncbi:MAG: hypothetical protein VB108_05120 [Anaerolineaceae bacterium]|nr:hypothetical protein [Anaerolineaceae bacterium]
MKPLQKIFTVLILTCLFAGFFFLSTGSKSAQAKPLVFGNAQTTPQSPMDQGSGEPTLFMSYLPFIFTGPPEPVYPGEITPIGPQGVSITSIVVDPWHKNIVYAGAFGWGVLKSVDSGTNWYKSGTGMPANSAIQSLALIPGSPNIVFAGTINDGLYRSENYGDSWVKVDLGYPNNAVYGITPDPNKPNVLYAVSRLQNGDCGNLRGAFYRSEDWGKTWTLLRYGDVEGTCADYWYDVDVNPWDSNTVYLSYHQHGPYRSTDYASSFTPLRNGIDMPESLLIETRSIAIDTLSKRMYSAYWDPTYVYYSDNMGEQWNKLGYYGSGVTKMVLGPLNSAQQRVFLCTFGSGIAYSDNRGITWTDSIVADDGKVPYIVYDLAVSNAAQEVWYAATQFAGLFISKNNGTSWFQAGTGIVSSSVGSLVSSPSLPGKTIAAVYGQGVMTTADNGLTWQSLNNGLDSNYVTSVYDLDGALFALADSGVYRFDGTAWQSQQMPQARNPNLSAYTGFAAKNFPIEQQLAEKMLGLHQNRAHLAQKGGLLPGNTPPTQLVKSGNLLYAATAGNGLWVKEGPSWVQVGFEGLAISALASNPLTQSVVVSACAGSGHCSVYAKDGAYWQEISPNIQLPQLSALLITEEGALFAATGNGLYQWQSNSQSWQMILGQGTAFTSLALSPDGSKMAATAVSGLWLSQDGGKSWVQVEGLPADLTYTSVLFASDGYVLVGSNSRGAFKISLP